MLCVRFLFLKPITVFRTSAVNRFQPLAKKTCVCLQIPTTVCLYDASELLICRSLCFCVCVAFAFCCHSCHYMAEWLLTVFRERVRPFGRRLIRFSPSLLFPDWRLPARPFGYRGLFGKRLRHSDAQTRSLHTLCRA